MIKSMYSLMLMDDVVEKIDEMAQANNTNRSNLINQILAEYVSLTTPEKRIGDIFSFIDTIFGVNSSFTSYLSPYDSIMSLKSSLNYKYRPTIKYTVELYRNATCNIGEIKAIFRTQSAELLLRLNDFFKLWIGLEKLYLRDYFHTNEIVYSCDSGKFTRSINIPDGKTYSVEELAKAISEYIRIFDLILKNYLNGKYENLREIEKQYINYINNSALI